MNTQVSKTRAIFVLTFMVCFLLFCSQPSLADDNPPSRVARVSYLKGKVSFQPAGQDQWSEATINFTVTTGDRLYTDKGARAELEVGPYTVRLAERTDLIVTNLNDEVMQLGLEGGTIRLSVYELSSGNTFEVDTPHAALTVLAPGTYRADAEPDENRTLVAVNSGSLEVSAEGISQTLQSGEAVELTGENGTEVASIPMPALDSFDQWSERRDARLSASASAKYVSRGIAGYDDLDDYGRWEMVAEYGPVWYPTGLAPGWVPYRFGHWAWVDPWGWTWVEDEPWGFCPFHYGRWVFIGTAWGWIPGPYVPLPVYTPALVAFVGGSGFSVSVGVGPVELAAWFPLGPDEPFFPWYHYGGDYLRIVNITNIRNVTNIANITNVTNISEVHYKYRTVAATAVPARILSSGQPVAHHVVRVPPESLARAQVVPHPTVNPTVRAALPGRPVPPPPVTSRLVPARGPTAAAGARRPSSEVRQPPPVTARKAPPLENNRTPAPSPTESVSPRAHIVAPPRETLPPLITRSAPPPPHVPFAERRPLMNEHPGRPLEPQQLEKLRTGRPPGPMADPEFPPHVIPVPRERPAPIPHPAPAPPPRPHKP
jgi:FecR protein